MPSFALRGAGPTRPPAKTEKMSLALRGDFLSAAFPQTFGSGASASLASLPLGINSPFDSDVLTVRAQRRRTCCFTRSPRQLPDHSTSPFEPSERRWECVCPVGAVHSRRRGSCRSAPAADPPRGSRSTSKRTLQRFACGLRANRLNSGCDFQLEFEKRICS